MTPTLELILREMSAVLADSLAKLVVKLPGLTTQIEGWLMRSVVWNYLVRNRLQRFKKFKPRL